MADKKPTERLYIIRETGSKKPVALVKEKTAPAALAKYVESKMFVAYASQDEIIEAMNEGITPFVPPTASDGE